MNESTYPFERTAGNRLRFEFESVSPTKRVRKVVEYQPLDNQNRAFNLALLDQHEDGTASDLTVTNNADMVKILATVFQTMRHLFLHHPANMVVFQGSTPARTRLYRMAIAHSLITWPTNFTWKDWGKQSGGNPFEPINLTGLSRCACLIRTNCLNSNHENDHCQTSHTIQAEARAQNVRFGGRSPASQAQSSKGFF